MEILICLQCGCYPFIILGVWVGGNAEMNEQSYCMDQYWIFASIWWSILKHAWYLICWIYQKQTILILQFRFYIYRLLLPHNEILQGVCVSLFTVLIYLSFFLQVDFWQPNSATLICQNATVDVHVKRNDTRGLHARLKQEHIDYR